MIRINIAGVFGKCWCCGEDTLKMYFEVFDNTTEEFLYVGSTCIWRLGVQVADENGNILTDPQDIKDLLDRLSRQAQSLLEHDAVRNNVVDHLLTYLPDDCNDLSREIRESMDERLSRGETPLSFTSLRKCFEIIDKTGKEIDLNMLKIHAPFESDYHNCRLTYKGLMALSATGLSRSKRYREVVKEARRIAPIEARSLPYLIARNVNEMWRRYPRFIRDLVEEREKKRQQKIRDKRLKELERFRQKQMLEYERMTREQKLDQMFDYLYRKGPYSEATHEMLSNLEPRHGLDSADSILLDMKRKGRFNQVRNADLFDKLINRIRSNLKPHFKKWEAETKRIADSLF